MELGAEVFVAPVAIAHRSGEPRLREYLGDVAGRNEVHVDVALSLSPEAGVLAPVQAQAIGRVRREALAVGSNERRKPNFERLHIANRGLPGSLDRRGPAAAARLEQARAGCGGQDHPADPADGDPLTRVRGVRLYLTAGR